MYLEKGQEVTSGCWVAKNILQSHLITLQDKSEDKFSVLKRLNTRRSQNPFPFPSPPPQLAGRSVLSEFFL